MRDTLLGGDALKLHQRTAALLNTLPRVDPRELHALGDALGGSDRAVLAQGGRDGHVGVKGMRERAKLAGGRLAIWSAEGAGTEIEVTIPASHAYAGRAAEHGAAMAVDGDG